MSAEAFQLHQDFLTTSHAAAELELCHVRLQDDARFPWLILIPRVAGLRELDELDAAGRARLTEEQVLAARAVRALGEARGRPVWKLNVAALGNVTPQLHVHVIGRRRDDDCWPAPVWGRGEPEPYAAAARAAMIAAAKAALSPGA